MTTTIPGAARCTSWNAHLYVDSKLIAGVFQRSDLISVADLAHELDLCFILDKPDGLWQPALLPRAALSADRSLIVLDHQDESPIPTPSKVDAYTFVFHSSSRCANRDRHSLEGTQHLLSYLGTAANSFQTSVFDAWRSQSDGLTHAIWISRSSLRKS